MLSYIAGAACKQTCLGGLCGTATGGHGRSAALIQASGAFALLAERRDFPLFPPRLPLRAHMLDLVDHLVLRQLEEKRAILTENFADGVAISEVARRHGLGPLPIINP